MDEKLNCTHIAASLRCSMLCECRLAVLPEENQVPRVRQSPGSQLCVDQQDRARIAADGRLRRHVHQNEVLYERELSRAENVRYVDQKDTHKKSGRLLRVQRWRRTLLLRARRMQPSQ